MQDPLVNTHAVLKIQNEEEDMLSHYLNQKPKNYSDHILMKSCKLYKNDIHSIL